MYGFFGSGKFICVEQFVEVEGMICVCFDVECQCVGYFVVVDCYLLCVIEYIYWCFVVVCKLGVGVGFLMIVDVMFLVECQC